MTSGEAAQAALLTQATGNRRMTGVKGNPRQLNFKNLTPFIPGIPPHDKGGVQRTLLYLKGVFQQPGRGAAAVAVKERTAPAVPWAQSAWDAGEPDRERTETNASFFLDSTLFGKTQETNHQFTSPHLLPAEEGSSPETKRLWLGNHPPSAGLTTLRQPTAWWSALQTQSSQRQQKKAKEALTSKTTNTSHPTSPLPTTLPDPKPK